MKDINPIKLARMRAGFTQAEIAEKLNVSSTAVSMWETGVTHPTAKKLKPLAEALGTTVDELLTG